MQSKRPQGAGHYLATFYLVRRALGLVMVLLVLGTSFWPTALATSLAAHRQVPVIANYYLGNDASQWHTNQQVVMEQALLYSTFLGGNGNDKGRKMVLDKEGNIYIIGRTTSVDFTGTTQRPAGADDVVVAKLDPTGKQVLYVTLIGGRGVDDGIALAVTKQGEVWATVQPGNGFPVTNTLFPGERSSVDAALIRLSPTGQLNYSARLNLANFSTDVGRNIDLDQIGNVYITGRNINTFTTPLLKIDPTGSSVLWERSYGERMQSVALAIGTDEQVYMTGFLDNTSLPVTPDALQPTCSRFRGQETCSRDAYILVADADGDVSYASYFGGTDQDRPEAIAVDQTGAIYLGGQTYSKDLPMRNAIQASCPSGLNDDQTACYFYEGFVTKFSPDGRGIVYSTYLDATLRSSDSSIVGITTDGSGNAYLTGRVDGADFPLKDPLQDKFGGGLCDEASLCYDAFVTKLDPGGALVYSTYLGGRDDDLPYDIVITAAGDAFVMGTTYSSTFPVTEDAAKPEWGVLEDLYLARIGAAVAQSPTATVTPKPTTSIPTMPTSTGTATLPASTATSTPTLVATTVTAMATLPATITPTSTAIAPTATATTNSSGDERRNRVYLPLVQRIDR